MPEKWKTKTAKDLLETMANLKNDEKKRLYICREASGHWIVAERVQTVARKACTIGHSHPKYAKVVWRRP